MNSSQVGVIEKGEEGACGNRKGGNVAGYLGEYRQHVIREDKKKIENDYFGI